MSSPVSTSPVPDLHEQIKLLVRTEHQLHRSQSALDRQLLRVELLSHFALRWDSQSPPAAILADAVALFRRLFAVDHVQVATPPVSSHAPHGPHGSRSSQLASATHTSPSRWWSAAQRSQARPS